MFIYSNYNTIFTQENKIKESNLPIIRSTNYPLVIKSNTPKNQHVFMRGTFTDQKIFLFVTELDSGMGQIVEGYWKIA
jgi:hypothetical protein